MKVPATIIIPVSSTTVDHFKLKKNGQNMHRIDLHFCRRIYHITKGLCHYHKVPCIFKHAHTVTVPSDLNCIIRNIVFWRCEGDTHKNSCDEIIVRQFYLWKLRHHFCCALWCDRTLGYFIININKLVQQCVAVEKLWTVNSTYLYGLSNRI